jgi:hypothetical protein
MKKFVYLCITPESLIASHLPPAEFGSYLATGTRKRLRGQAIFLEVDPGKIDKFPMEYMNERLIPYANGEPKRSLYLSIYRALENTPLESMRKLYLATDDGKVLEIKSRTYSSRDTDMIHLYQQLTPISTRVASKLSPPEFINFLTDPGKAVSAPRVFMVDLKLNQLATDPGAPIHNLPYPNPDHLRSCLSALMTSGERLTKTVIRHYNCDLSYRTIENGFFVGDQESYLYYPFPTIDKLEGEYYSWWRSALTHCF